ncbi:MAG: hypothetical protein JXC32_19305 [Anaerolineae bacterium]|nr:hypothetical protein [Anaerolineae bacterium]
MNLLLSLLLIALGLLLWVVAGLLPVAELRAAGDALVLALKTTWMGAVTLSRREMTGVRDARFVQDPNVRRGGQVQIRRDGPWEPLSVGFLPDAVLQAQLAELIRRFVHRRDAARNIPAELSLAMRGRLNLMLGFAVFFPLGTVSIFTGILLLTRGL